MRKLCSESERDSECEDRNVNFLDLDRFIFTAAALPEGLAVQLESTSDFRLEIQIIVQTVGLQAASRL